MAGNNNRFKKAVCAALLAAALFVIVFIPIAPKFGIAVNDAMWAAWGMAIAKAFAILYSMLTTGTEEAVYRQPANWRLKKLVIEAEEKQ